MKVNECRMVIPRAPGDQKRWQPGDVVVLHCQGEQRNARIHTLDQFSHSEALRIIQNTQYEWTLCRDRETNRQLLLVDTLGTDRSFAPIFESILAEPDKQDL